MGLIWGIWVGLLLETLSLLLYCYIAITVDDGGWIVWFNENRTTMPNETIDIKAMIFVTIDLEKSFSNFFVKES